jgi:hypothetical protein
MISSVSCVSSSTPASPCSDDQRAVARRSRRATGESDPRAQGNSEGPRRSSQHPAYQRPPTTKDIRRQRATTPIFTQERAPPIGRHRRLSEIDGWALCGQAFPQVTWERQGRRDAFLAGSFQAVRASQAGPTAPVGDSSISLPAVAEAWPADAGDQARPDGSGPGPGRHRPSADAPRTWPRAQRQPQPLRRAIPTLTGAVLVVNAAWTSSSALLRSPAADAAERCRSAAAAGLSIWLQG